MYRKWYKGKWYKGVPPREIRIRKFIFSVATTTRPCEFRSLAFLSVYRFGPRFLSFTVRNTSN